MPSGIIAPHALRILHRNQIYTPTDTKRGREKERERECVCVCEFRW